MVMEAWPMNVESAFAFTPAAIISDANVWRHSCSPIASSFAASHALPARARAVDGPPGELLKSFPPCPHVVCMDPKLLAIDDQARKTALRACEWVDLDDVHVARHRQGLLSGRLLQGQLTRYGAGSAPAWTSVRARSNT